MLSDRRAHDERVYSVKRAGHFCLEQKKGWLQNRISTAARAKNRTQQDNKPQKERFPLPFEACFLHDSFGAGVLRQLLLGFSLLSVPPAGRLRAPPGSPHRDGAQGSPCRGAIPRSQSGTSIPEHVPAPKRPAKSQPETPCRDATPERHTKPPHRSAAPSPAPECPTGTPHRYDARLLRNRKRDAFLPSSTKNKQSLVPVRGPEKLSSGAACKIVE